MNVVCALARNRLLTFVDIWAHSHFTSVEVDVEASSQVPRRIQGLLIMVMVLLRQPGSRPGLGFICLCFRCSTVVRLVVLAVAASRRRGTATFFGLLTQHIVDALHL